MPDIEINGDATTTTVQRAETFEREAFQRMLGDIEGGKINCIVVKDLSRWAGTPIDTGTISKKIFLSMVYGLSLSTTI